MSVIVGSVGIHGKFVQKLKDHQAWTNAGEEVAEDSPEPAGSRKHPHDFSIDQADFIQILSLQLRQLFNAAIAVNPTAFEDADPETSKVIFIGNKSETALLKFAKDLGWANYKKTRDVANIVQMIPFSSGWKTMGIIVKLSGGRWRLYLKGTSEILTKKCTQHVIVSKNIGAHNAYNEEVRTARIDDMASDNISRTIIFYVNQTL